MCVISKGTATQYCPSQSVRPHTYINSESNSLTFRYFRFYFQLIIQLHVSKPNNFPVLSSTLKVLVGDKELYLHLQHNLHLPDPPRDFIPILAHELLQQPCRYKVKGHHMFLFSIISRISELQHRNNKECTSLINLQHVTNFSSLLNALFFFCKELNLWILQSAILTSNKITLGCGSQSWQ